MRARSLSWFFLGCASFPAVAAEVMVFTNAVAKPQIANVDAGSFIGTVNTCVHADLQGVIGEGKNNNVDCGISYTAAGGGATLKTAGKGLLNEPKYNNNAATSFQSTQNIGNGNNTLASAVAQFASANPVNVNGKRTFPVTLTAMGDVGQVQAGGAAAVAGLAASRVTDPFTFTYSTAGSLSYSFSLGDDSIDPQTGKPVPNLGLFSNSSSGQNHIDISASLTGVMFDGKSFDGQIFRLVIDANGVIDSPAEIKVAFVPAVQLGLTQSQIEAIDAYIDSAFHLQSDGSVGLDPGTELALIGGGSPLSELAFSALPGTVVYTDSIVAGAQIPEPASWALLAMSVLGCIASTRCRSRGAWP